MHAVLLVSFTVFVTIFGFVEKADRERCDDEDNYSYMVDGDMVHCVSNDDTGMQHLRRRNKGKSRDTGPASGARLHGGAGH